ncbi:MAG: TlpA family protein disulfide reductase [Niabella sp.]|nr:TlpA family protein disulfide reductase [Niabella sp.]
MRNFIITLFCLQALASVTCAQDNPAQLLKKHELIAKMVLDKRYPEFKIRSGSLRLNQDSLKGRVTFINFWFEACPPCQAEMDGLNALYQNMKDSVNFQFYSFTFESPATIKRLTKKGILLFPAYALSGDETNTLSFGAGYPTNIIIDTQGIIRYFRAGGSRDKAEAARYINTRIQPLIVSLLK